MEKQKVDYSLYLVTDSTEAILGSRDLVQVVEQALSGGWSVPITRLHNIESICKPKSKYLD